MNLLYARTPTYLSPSSLSSLEEDPLAFYLDRLAPEEFKLPKEPQGYAASCGLAFHQQVAAHLSGTRPSFDEVIEEKDRAIGMARRLLLAYEELGLLAEFKGCEVEWDVRGPVPGTSNLLEPEGVPVRGIVDVVHRTRRGIKIPHDWKTSAANRPGSQSPKPGYVRLFDTAKPDEVKRHPRAGEPLEQLNPSWAAQLATYTWLLNPGPLRVRRVSVDQVLVGEDGRVRIAQYRTTVGVAFQRELRDRYCKAWAAIHEGTLVNSTLSLEQLRMLA